MTFPTLFLIYGATSLAPPNLFWMVVGGCWGMVPKSGFGMTGGLVMPPYWIFFGLLLSKNYVSKKLGLGWLTILEIEPG